MSAPRTKRQYQPSSSQPIITSHFRPALPTQEIQANLLSVGMRVRKSVPEGYKTHKTLPALAFTSSAPAVMQPRERTGRTLVRTASGGHGRELTPFCGLHKVGGWGMQESDEEEEEEEGVPGLSGSQGTLLSSQGSFRGLDVRQVAGNVRKRGYEEEVEEQMDAFFAEEMEVKEERPMARLKGGRKMGGGGVVRIAGGVDGDDFEEAPFLAPVEGMEVDG